MKDIDQKAGHVDNQFYVYTWYRPDKKQIFYVGKGRGKRSSNTNKRNKHFKSIIQRLDNLGLASVVTIVADGLTESRAFELETELISKHKRIRDGGTLCNMTDGGDGSSGVIKSKASRQLTSDSIRKTLSDPATRLKISQRGIKRYEDVSERRRHGDMVSERYQDPAAREKTAASLRGKPKTAAHVNAVRTSLNLTWQSLELREAHRRITLKQGPRKGSVSGFKGVSFDKSCGKWLAQIEVSGRNKHLGRHSSPEDAASAYDRGAAFYYGDDVYQNFPKPTENNDNKSPQQTRIPVFHLDKFVKLGYCLRTE